MPVSKWISEFPFGSYMSRRRFWRFWLHSLIQLNKVIIGLNLYLEKKYQIILIDVTHRLNLNVGVLRNMIIRALHFRSLELKRRTRRDRLQNRE